MELSGTLGSRPIQVTVFVILRSIISILFLSVRFSTQHCNICKDISQIRVMSLYRRCFACTQKEAALRTLFTKMLGPFVLGMEFANPFILAGIKSVS